MNMAGRFFALLFLCRFFVSAQAAEAPPELKSVRLTNQVELSWTDVGGGDYVLEVTDRLGTNSNWWPARRDARLESGRRFVSVTPSLGNRFYRLRTNDYAAWFQTTQGEVASNGAGVILPHEHIFTDLRGPTVTGYGQADIEDVVRVMKPRLVEAKESGVGVLVECSSIGVGRNVTAIRRLSEESGLPVIVPTGVYGRANFAPPVHRTMTEDELAALFIKEIREDIEGTGSKAGFIKISTSDASLTALEEKLLRAAGRAALATGAVVASHTAAGSVARRQTDILESISPSIRFIWVHAQVERNRTHHRELAARGVFIEFDSLGWPPSEDNSLITAIKELLGAGHGDRILLSHDAGWYQPGQPNGGTQKPYTYLHKTFIPKLKNSGLADATIRMITEENPARAFAFMRPPLKGRIEL
jgi:phosphotriesterase-related protein